jgi:uncharacterized protein (DUF433 family)
VFRNTMAAQWYPDPDRSNAIVVDPAVALGQPTVQGTRIPAYVLYKAFNAEKSIERVGDWYHVDPSIVHQAVDFATRFPV